MKRVKVIAGSANPELAARIASLLGVPLGRMHVESFPDGESNPCVVDPVDGCVAVLVQPTSPAVNENLMELLLSVDSLLRAGACRVIAVVPYFGYARQCKETPLGSPLSAKVVAQLIEQVGAGAVIASDLHDPTISRHISIPFWNVRTEEAIANYIRASFSTEKNVVIVAPDRGGADRAHAVATRLSLPAAVLEKKRERAGGSVWSAVAEAEIGSLEGKRAIIVDDMVSTGSTLVAAALTLRRQGADVLGAVCTHGILCSGAPERLEQVALRRLAISDSVSVSCSSPVLERFSIAAPLVAVITEATKL